MPIGSNTSDTTRRAYIRRLTIYLKTETEAGTAVEAEAENIAANHPRLHSDMAGKTIAEAY